MIAHSDKQDCCGCSACADVCAHKSIKMRPDSEGFLYPDVDSDLCIDCGLCESVCPMLGDSSILANDHSDRECYLAYQTDRRQRRASSSGGVFPLLGTEILRRGGKVAGAVYDCDFKVVHRVSDNPKLMERMRGSKYVQSDTSGVFREIRRLLAKGETVLMSGTPCQIAALRRSLGGCDQENLYTLEIVCHGVPSPLMLRQYVAMLERRQGSRLSGLNMRSKRDGWLQGGYEAEFADGSRVLTPQATDVYSRGFLTDTRCLRPSCLKCRFKGAVHADLAIGDFWGLEHIDPAWFNAEGNSLVTVNSTKGRRLIEAVSDRLTLRREDFDTACNFNSMIIRSEHDRGRDREALYGDMRSLPFEETARRHFALPGKADVRKWRLKNKAKEYYCMLMRLKHKLL